MGSNLNLYIFKLRDRAAKGNKHLMNGVNMRF